MAAGLPRLETAGPWHAVLEAPLRGALEATLPGYLLGQRWFGGKARAIAAVAVLDAAPVADDDDAPRVALLEVRYAEGPPELYSLPLAFVAAGPPPRAGGRAPPAPVAALATVVAGGRSGLLLASDRDPAFARLVLDAIARGGRFEAARGAFVAWSTPALARAAAGTETTPPAPLGAEQSNTSMRVGDRLLLKLFRRVEPGPNPDLELGAFLARAGFRHTPPLLGAVEYRRDGGEPLALGILQAFVRSDGDAWKLMLGEVEACLRDGSGPAPVPGSADAAELLACARATPPPAIAAAAGRALEHAALLGRRTAELHAALAGGDAPELRPEPFREEDARALAAAVDGEIARALALLAARRDALRGEVRARADLVLGAAEALRSRLRALATRPLRSLRTRTHGDYHLGQVLFTGEDFAIIDFEGEPARPLAERRAKGSPLRDVAGMLRSFHYASFAAAAPAGRTRPDEAAWRRAWFVWAAAAFLRGYIDPARRGGILPEDESELVALLDLHLAEKAFYELGYELNNRPDWVGLPLEGILDLGGATEDVVAKKTRDGRGGAGASAPAGSARPVTAPPASPATTVLRAAGPGELDQHLWSEGTNVRAYRTMGAHPAVVDGVEGTSFAVWAPNAERVSVIGDFNGWVKDAHPLHALGLSGIWQGFVPGVKPGAVYKYHLRSRHHGYEVDKADPFGFFHESAPGTQSIVTDLAYGWGDAEWMRARRQRNGFSAPMSIYEVHLGSWQRGEGNRILGYRELAPRLADYCAEMGFTHVEVMPVTEHPFYGSWGYQTTGYFAPTSRYGTPQDFMFLVDTLHQRGIGVLLDWVPSHFPADVHGLSYFDGTHLFEHADRRQGHHPDWDSYIFNYGRNEVRAFLLSSALFWLDVYHLDGLRVDAVASMLYLDYSRKEGEWIPNRHGGRENLEAIAFLRTMNETVYREYPDVQTVAEESTSWPMVSRPLYVGGLGFGMKWDMGWMHDTLSYFAHEPIHRRFHHNDVTFRMMYAFAENFVLPLSHDEVVHGKRSLLDKMPGDGWQKFANLRLLLGYMWAQPGKKLLFMGGEFGQGREWNHDRSLDWHLLGSEWHQGVRDWVRDLNHVMRDEPALHARDFDPRGFEWVDCNDAEESVLLLLRRAEGHRDVLVALNFTPVPRHGYRVGVPRGGFWKELLNSDAPRYGGSGIGNLGGQEAAPVGAHGRHHSLVLTLPPLAAVFLAPAE